MGENLIMSVEMIEKLILFSHFEFQLYKNRKYMFLRKLFTNVLGKRIIKGDTEEFSFFCSTKRSDLNALFDKIYESCPYKKCKLELKKIKILNLSFLLGLIKNIYFLKEIDKYLINLCEVNKISLKEKLYIYVDKVAQDDFRKSISELNLKKIKHFVVLEDALLYEQTVVEYFNYLNINTITAQHAIFFLQDNFDNVQKLNYYNAPSNYVLTWGKNSNKLFEKFSPNIKKIICGNPIILKKDIVSSNFIAVAGDSVVFLENNKKMIEVAEQYAKKHSIKLLIRLHPSDNINNYKIDTSVTSFEKNIEEAYFIILHASSMLCNYMAQGRAVFRYKDDVKLDYIPSSIEFSSVNELEKLVQKINKINFYELSKENIAYIGIDSMKKYKQAFEYIKYNEINEN